MIAHTPKYFARQYVSGHWVIFFDATGSGGVEEVREVARFDKDHGDLAVSAAAAPEMRDLLTDLLPLVEQEAERRRMAGPEELGTDIDGRNPYWTEMETAETRTRALLSRLGGAK